jgi:hypothetical protein
MTAPIPIRKIMYYVEPEKNLFSVQMVPYSSGEAAWNAANICAKLCPGTRIFIRRGEEIIGSLMVNVKEEA